MRSKSFIVFMAMVLVFFGFMFMGCNNDDDKPDPPKPPPTIEAIADQTIYVGEEINPTKLVGHSQSGEVEFSIQSQSDPEAVECELTDDLVTSKPAEKAGSSVITILATDVNGLTATRSFIVTVKQPDNLPPQVNIPDQNLIIGDPLAIDLRQAVKDEDPFDKITVIVNNQTDPSAIDMSLDDGYLKGDLANHAGENKITLTFTDSKGESTVHIFTIFITPPPITRPVYGLNFSPYLPGQSPHVGSKISAEQIRQRLLIIAPYTEWIRTFGVTDGLEETGRIAHELGLKTAIGAWLSKDINMNETQLNKLIELALAGHVDVAIIGSEVLLRGDLTEDQLLGYINRFKAEVPDVPVTYGEVYGELIAHPNVILACDVVFANFYSYWEGYNIKKAVANLNTAYESLKKVSGSKEIIVSEVGWPSAGNQIGEAVPSEENSSFHFLNVVSWALAKNVKVIHFEAFDEEWKVRDEGEQGAHWGIWYEDGVLKPGMQAVFDGETMPDNWSCNPFPGDPNLPPKILITAMAPYGTNGYAEGQVNNVQLDLYQIAVYIKVGGWWTKPTWASPITRIGCGGYWICNIATGGLDYNATQVAAFLIPVGYSPPSLGGQGILPQELYDNAVAYVIADRS